MTDTVQERPDREAEPESRLYRVLLLTPEGNVALTRRVALGSDGEARALAASMVDGHAVELWDGVRFIEHFEVEGSDSSETEGP